MKNQLSASQHLMIRYGCFALELDWIFSNKIQSDTENHPSPDIVYHIWKIGPMGNVRERHGLNLLSRLTAVGNVRTISLRFYTSAATPQPHSIGPLRRRSGA